MGGRASVDSPPVNTAMINCGVDDGGTSCRRLLFVWTPPSLSVYCGRCPTPSPTISRVVEAELSIRDFRITLYLKMGKAQSLY
jgi:hypothetical protein